MLFASSSARDWTRAGEGTGLSVMNDR
jgi:hypothetical protein